MKLSNKGRYAVMAMVDLARSNPNNPTSLAEISLRQGISLSFLEQIFLKLKNKNIVHSVRGVKGGYKLIKEPSKIKLAEIFNAVDERIKTLNCNKYSKKGCNGKSTKCITHNLWDELELYINNFFENKKLSDLINQQKETQI